MARIVPLRAGVPYRRYGIRRCTLLSLEICGESLHGRGSCCRRSGFPRLSPSWGSGLRKLRRSWQPGRQVRGRSRRSGTLRLFGFLLQSGRVLLPKESPHPRNRSGPDWRRKMPRDYDALFNVWEIHCIECGCGVSLTGEHLLNASELKCPGCHRNLELQAVKIAVKAAVRLEASTFHCLSHKIHLIPPRFATANVTPEIAQLTSPDVCRENRYNQQKLASGEPLTDEEYLSLTR